MLEPPADEIGGQVPRPRRAILERLQGWIVFGMILAGFGSVARAAETDDPTGGWSADEDASGARIWVKALPDSPVVRITAMVPVGGDDDPIGLEGVAHLTEHVLLFSGTGQTEEQARDEVQSRGGSLNGFTSADHTTYYVELPAESWKDCLRILRDHLLIRPSFSSSAVEAERRAVLLETKLDATLPGPVERWRAAWFREPTFWEREYEMPPTGIRSQTRGSIERIGVDHVEAFWRRWYGPQNLTFAVVGDVDPEQVRAEMHQLLLGVRPFGQTATSRVAGRTRPGVNLRYQVSDDSDGAFLVGLHLADATPEDYSYGILLRSILRNALYDRLAATRSSQKVDSGFWWKGGNLDVTVSATVAPAAVDPAIAAARALLDDLAQGALPESEYDALRLRAITPILTANTTPAAFFDNWFDSDLWDRDSFRSFPPVVQIIREADQPRFAAWLRDRLLPGGRVESVSRPISPEAVGALWLSLVVVVVALRPVGRRVFASEVDVRRLRYWRTLRWGPWQRVGAAFALVVLGVVGAVVAQAIWLGLKHATEHIPWTPLHYAMRQTPWAGLAVLVGIASNAVPRRLLLFEHELRVKSYGWRSWAVPWGEVLAAEHRRGPLGSSVAITLAGGRSLTVHTHGDEELVAEIQRLRGGR